MADFTEGMKAFTDRLKASIDERGESLAQVHQATTDLLGGARDFLEQVSLEHDARAERVHAFMSESRATRLEASRAMRQAHREGLASMTEELHHDLDEANKGRLEAVGMMRDKFKAARTELASDLREAAKTWREFAASR